MTPIGKITQTTLSWAFKNNIVKKKAMNTDEYNCQSVESIKLSDIQKNIYNQIHQFFLKDLKPQFLYGIPGSGKTEIYLKLTD